MDVASEKANHSGCMMTPAVLSLDRGVAVLKSAPAVASVVAVSDFASVAFADIETPAFVSVENRVAALLGVGLASYFADAPRPAAVSVSPIVVSGPKGETRSLGPTSIFGNGLDDASLETGQTFYVRLPYGGTITSWQVLSIGECSCEIDVWKAHEEIPSVVGSIVGTSKPMLVADEVNSSSVLTGWQSEIVVGDVLGFHLQSVSGSPKQIMITLRVE